MLDYVSVATRDRVPPGSRLAVWAGGRKVLLYHIGDKYYATDEQCSHRECSLLDGPLSGTVVTCPCHLARFDVTTGKVLSPPATVSLPTYPIKVEGNHILVGVDITDLV